MELLRLPFRDSFLISGTPANAVIARDIFHICYESPSDCGSFFNFSYAALVKYKLHHQGLVYATQSAGPHPQVMCVFSMTGCAEWAGSLWGEQMAGGQKISVSCRKCL